MSRFKTAFIPVILPVLVVAALAGCGGATTTTPATPEPEYAAEITETVIQGLAGNDLEKYTRYGNAEFKAAVTPEVLANAAVPLKDQYGAYESKQYLYTETQGEYTIVHYKAKFAKGDLGIRMVFDTDHLVAGQWFE
jgi:hypothetical protein